MATAPAPHNYNSTGVPLMRKLRVSVILAIAAAFALIGAMPQSSSAAQRLPQGKLSHASRQRAMRHLVMRVQVRPQQAGPTPALVATPSIFEDKQGLDGSGPAFVVPITNVSPTATIQVGTPTSDNPNAFNLSTTCTTLAPGASCTLSITATVESLCDDVFADITIPSNDPAGPLDLEAEVWGADNNFNITNLTDSSITPQSLAQSLVGTGVTISNVKYTGAAVAAGHISIRRQHHWFQQRNYFEHGKRSRSDRPQLRLPIHR